MSAFSYIILSVRTWFEAKFLLNLLHTAVSEHSYATKSSGFDLNPQVIDYNLMEVNIRS